MVKLTKKQIKELYSTPIGYRKHGEKNIPIFIAIEDEGSRYGTSMKMFCPRCDIWHIHGIDDRVGHRVAHCGDRFVNNKWGETELEVNPLRDTGYFLVRVDER